jgi:hypothetical protein
MKQTSKVTSRKSARMAQTKAAMQRLNISTRTDAAFCIGCVGCIGCIGCIGCLSQN